MKILWVKVGGLWPLNTGGRLRTFHTVAELSRRHHVTVVTTHGPADDPSGLRAELRGCESVVSVPRASAKQGTAAFAVALMRSWCSPLPVDLWKWRVPAVRAAAERRIADVDVCIADFLTAVPNVPLHGRVPVVQFSHNVEHMIWKRLADVERAPWRRALLELEWRKMRRYERWATRHVRRTIAVSEADRRMLAALAPGAAVHAIGTGVDTRYFTPNGHHETPASLVFTGAMDWYPNEDGIVHFIDAILPRVRGNVPNVSLTIVGRNPTPRVRAAAAAARVNVTGTVEDVRPYVADAAVYVVPLRVGGGTRLKIFEALAMGKAVVSTTVGAEGLPLVPGEHFVQADDPASFGSAVVALLRDPARRVALGAAGRRLVEERYSWAQVARQFETHCEEVLARYAN